MASMYRFVEGGCRTGVLDWPSGKLSLTEGNANLEVFESWKDYVKNVQGDSPTTGDVTEICAQLSLTLGAAEAVNDDVVKEPPVKGKKNKPVTTGVPVENASDGEIIEVLVNEKGEETDMATVSSIKTPVGRSAVKKAAKPAKVKKEVAKFDPADCPICPCGCNQRTTKPTNRFIQTHDSKFHGLCRKVEKGEMKLSELTAEGRKLFAAEGRRVNSAKVA